MILLKLFHNLSKRPFPSYDIVVAIYVCHLSNNLSRLPIKSDFSITFSIPLQKINIPNMTGFKLTFYEQTLILFRINSTCHLQIEG